MDTYKVTYTWTKDEFLKSLRVNSRAKLRPSINVAANVTILLLVLLVIFLLVSPKDDSPSLSISAFLIISFGTYWIFFRYRVNEWYWARGFNKFPAANAVIEWTFSEHQIAQECSGLVSFNAEWKVISKVVEASDGFLLYTYPKNMFYWLPTTGFDKPEGIKQLESFVVAQNIQFTKLKI